MPPSPLEERLKSLLGLNTYEARVYLFLLRARGTSRPRDIAREAGVPYQRIYDVLESLARKGLVWSPGEGVYAAVDPSRALGGMAAEVLEEARRRAEMIRELAAELEKAVGGASASSRTRLVYGLPRVFEEALTAVASCRGKVYIMAYKGLEKAEEIRGYIEAMSSRLEVSGVSLVVVVPPEARLPGWVADAVGSLGGRIVRSPAAFLDMLVACDTVVIGLPGPGGVVAVVVENKEFSEALRERLERVTG